MVSDNKTEFWPSNISLTRFFVNGTIMEFVGNGVLYPFYLCKTHLQTNVESYHNKSSNPFMHLVKQVNTIIKRDGFKGLYRGYIWSTLGSFPGIISHITIYTIAKHKLNYQNTTHSIFRTASAAGASDSSDSFDSDTMQMQRHGHGLRDQEKPAAAASRIPQPLIPVLAAIVAESFAVLFYVPNEVVVQRLQLSSSVHNSHSHRPVRVWDIVKQVYMEDGLWKGFYRGTFASYMTYCPSAAIWWGSYELYKHYVFHADELIGYTIAGICGGFTTAVLTNPIDVIRTRLQTQTGVYGQSKIYPLISRLYSHEGLTGFSKGVGARIALLMLEGVVFADFYEILMHLSTTVAHE